MASLLGSPHPPARTPSGTSRAFRSHQNDFSPFGSLAELNAATTQMHSPRGGSSLPPTEEVADLGESFYGEEMDYGDLIGQMHDHTHGASRHPSRTGTAWGSRAGSIQHGTPQDRGQVYSIHDDQFLPPMAKMRHGSRSGSSREHDHEQYIPTVELHPDDQKYMYPPIQHVTSNSSRATVRHVSDDDIHHVIRTKSSRAAVQHSGYGGSDQHITRTKSSRASVHIPRNMSSNPVRSFVRPGTIPAHFELDGDNVIMQVYLPWTERLNDRPCRFHIMGVDGKPYSLEIDYQWTKMVQGTAKFRDAGLPRERGRGRGTLIIDWEIWFGEDDGDFSN